MASPGLLAVGANPWAAHPPELLVIGAPRGGASLPGLLVVGATAVVYTVAAVAACAAR